MIIDVPFRQDWTHKGHEYGTCLSHANTDLMYVNIPKNASSWTKIPLLELGWQFFNYHTDHLDKTVLVVLRDPVERWLSGIAEFLALYHSSFDLTNKETVELIFDRVCFDDHTERQINFLHGIDTNKCVFFYCDQNYRKNFAEVLASRVGPNRFETYAYEKVSTVCPNRTRFTQILRNQIQQTPMYLEQIKTYFDQDYKLLNSIKFYEPR